MKILNPNMGEDVVFVSRDSIYVYITDYGKIAFLKEIKVGAAQHTWYWMDLKVNVPIDISGIKNQYCTFENAINRAINDPYCTVYEFSSFDIFVVDYNNENIKYIDNIKTLYRPES